MDRAILAIAPDGKQERILGRVLPSWRRYARRHGLKIIVVRRSVTQGKHPYWDRWLTVQESEPEAARFDEVLLLDNDIFITDDAPDVFDHAGSAGISVVEESAQQTWEPAEIPDYYRRFHVEPDERLPRPSKVFNFGVCVLAREQRALFKALYEKWLGTVRPRFTANELRRRETFFRLEADGPFLSYELQAAGKISPLPAAFNFCLPVWLRKQHVRRLPFLLQAKAAQKLDSMIPRPVIFSLTSAARSAVRDAATQCHFLHFAASKSPLWLLPHNETQLPSCFLNHETDSSSAS